MDHLLFIDAKETAQITLSLQRYYIDPRNVVKSYLLHFSLLVSTSYPWSKLEKLCNGHVIYNPKTPSTCSGFHLQVSASENLKSQIVW